MSILSASMQSSVSRWLLLAALCLPALVNAHGLLLDADSDGGKITGTVYYSNGELAVHEPVELLDLTADKAMPIAGETDAAGKFSFPVTANHRYRVSAYGEEGHGVDVELVAAPHAKPTLVDDDAAVEERSWMPPAWAVIGVLLLASMVPILISRRRQLSSP